MMDDPTDIKPAGWDDVPKRVPDDEVRFGPFRSVSVRFGPFRDRVEFLTRAVRCVPCAAESQRGW